MARDKEREESERTHSKGAQADRPKTIMWYLVKLAVRGGKACVVIFR
jgi:hypothetical protein